MSFNFEVYEAEMARQRAAYEKDPKVEAVPFTARRTQRIGVISPVVSAEIGGREMPVGIIPEVIQEDSQVNRRAFAQKVRFNLMNPSGVVSRVLSFTHPVL